MVSAPLDAAPGAEVRVTFGAGETLGFGLYNPRAEMIVRMTRFGQMPPDEAYWDQLLQRAVDLRCDTLGLDSQADAYRVLHAEADGVPGLMVDRYGDTLSAEAFSLPMYQRVGDVLQRLAQKLGTKHWRVRMAPQAHGQEGFLAEPTTSEGAPSKLTIQEFGTRFRVDFSIGHKTGFFCDQRDNRKLLAQYCRGKTVLDLCSYTGGFAVQAKRLGEASEVTAVELDEAPLELAKENANLNQCRIKFAQADMFAYVRDLVRNGRLFDVVVLDPPKLIRSRMEIEEGTRRHFDMNRLAMQVVKPGGLLVSCSCSGLLTQESFVRLLHSAGQKAIPQDLPDTTVTEETSPSPRPLGRQVQILAQTGAAADHPVITNCLETEYLRTMWLRIL